MKFMIASDIHGSAHYCKLLCDAYKSESANRLILLGDLLYHGPRNDLPRDYNPKAVIEMLNCMSNDILAIRGNCDTEVDQMVLNFPILADYGVIAYDERLLYISHGHIFNEQSNPPIKPNDVLLNGHTHIPKCCKSGDFHYINVGSVSLPKENTKHSYVIFENNKFSFKDLESGLEYMTYNLK